jgi:uncharacterized protein (DUF433 family)
MQTSMITTNSKVLFGKPVVAGTRISVDHILEELAAGRSVEELVDSHPRLTREGVLAAISYARLVLRSEAIYPVGEDQAA